jgi:OHCU decarboxylase
MDLERLNSSTPEDCISDLVKCCGSRTWATRMIAERPFSSLADLNDAAERIWWSLSVDDWLEAFRSHPKIGEKKAETSTGAAAQKWSEQEQASVAVASAKTLGSLAELNAEYYSRFGFIFIVCASGKSSDEMLSLLRARLENDREKELHIAAAEQAKITGLRLEKLLRQ